MNKRKFIGLLFALLLIYQLFPDFKVFADSDSSSEIYQSETPYNMVFIDAGYSTVGAQQQDLNAKEDAKPLHIVYLDPYYFDILEVTNGQYAECVAAGACKEPEVKSSETRDPYYGVDWFSRFPVINVTWQDASDYCEYVGKRLPTEAEWEKAAMGAEDYRRYPWGNSDPKPYTINMTKVPGDTEMGNSYPKGASPYGVVDMVGNVSEWTSDWYSADYYSVSPEKNPTGPEEGTEKVVRGDSFKTDIHSIHITNRYAMDPKTANNYTGFRCAKDVRELVEYTITPQPEETIMTIKKAIVNSGQEEGVFVLEEPGVGKKLNCIAKNGSVVEVSEGPKEMAYTQWYKIRTQSGCEGWSLATSLNLQ